MGVWVMIAWISRIFGKKQDHPYFVDSYARGLSTETFDTKAKMQSLISQLESNVPSSEPYRERAIASIRGWKAAMNERFGDA